MNIQEQAIRFCCQHEWLYGILNVPQQPVTRGVLIVVGGPQYRVGSHRQFVLLARYLAERGIPVMRFDFRGMGDSDGAIRTFEHIGEDLRSAVDFFFSECPFLKDIVIWGLCDAASAALFHAHQDPRVRGLVLLNPWVRTEQGIAKAYLKHYYLERLFELEFWRKLLGGKFNALASIRSLYEFSRNSLRGGKNLTVSEESAGSSCNLAIPLPERMLNGLKHFQGKILIITSGNDLTAREFLDLVNSSMDWQAAMKTKQTEFFHIESANHTFSTRGWRDQVAELTGNRVLSW
ncbi:hydrolase 1, exosortase A system-associated [Nitrosomonas sp.]|uniref:hydrolase 1, exosortase A system-associated n=1 Tax=Nitrosomonas sp. TaxID=42353 RepID=UPI00330672C7